MHNCLNMQKCIKDKDLRKSKSIIGPRSPFLGLAHLPCHLASRVGTAFPRDTATRLLGLLVARLARNLAAILVWGLDARLLGYTAAILLGNVNTTLLRDPPAPC